MSPETPSKPTKLCPTCGSRVSEDAPRCLVCGTDLTGTAKSSQPAKSLQGSRMPQVTLNLPALLGLLALFLGIGIALMFYALRSQAAPAPDVTPTVSPTVTNTITPTMTGTPVTPTVTVTPLPTATPITYTVQLGDTCAGLAAVFGVSVQSIVLQNNLPADCTLSAGTSLQIPQPTPTVTPLPTSTLSAAEATEQACEKATYTVQDNDTLGSIAAAYNVPMAVIKEANGLPSDIVFSGQDLTIPLCQQNPTPGPTPTATALPPYPAPNLLLPAHGTDMNGESTVTLQWASVGSLVENEAYAVTIVDITQGEDRKLVEYVTDTKFLVPGTFRPQSNSPHAFEWWITTVRQTGTDDNGDPVWEAAGASSVHRVFIWSGSSQQGSTPTP